MTEPLPRIPSPYCGYPMGDGYHCYHRTRHESGLCPQHRPGRDGRGQVPRSRRFTEGMVLAAAGAMRCAWLMPVEGHPFGRLCAHEGKCLDQARAALEAAEEARR